MNWRCTEDLHWLHWLYCLLQSVIYWVEHCAGMRQIQSYQLIYVFQVSIGKQPEKKTLIAETFLLDKNLTGDSGGSEEVICLLITWLQSCCYLHINLWSTKSGTLDETLLSLDIGKSISSKCKYWHCHFNSTLICLFQHFFTLQTS